MTKALRRNGGVITLAGLYAFGYSETEVRGLVAHGDLRRLHRGVYGDGRAPLSDLAHLKAALLAVGDGAWLAGSTAAGVWGLEAVSLARIEVGVAAASTPRRAGILVRRTSSAPHRSEIRSRNGLRVSSVPRMLCEVARDSATLDDLVEAAIRKGILDLEAMETTLVRHTRTHGAGRLKRALADYRPRPPRKSPLEQSFDRWLARHPEIPEPERNVRFGVWELDCYWPAEALVLELDGRAYHIAARDFERDRLKDAWLQRQGLRVLRVTHHRWKHNRTGAQDDLLAMLALGQANAAA